MKTYVTFGQDHVHNINGKTIDKDCVAIVNGDLGTVFEIFGSKFCFEYQEQHWDKSKIEHFPRGYVEINMAKLTSEIVENKASASIKYPCLMRYKNSGVVVVGFTSKGIGSVVYFEGNSGQGLFDHSVYWNMDEFEPFNGSIKITQEPG